MTLLVAWTGIDSRGPASVYIATDSRLSWGKQSFFDHAMNAVLFLLIGLEVIALRFSTLWIAASIAFIPLSLFARFLGVAIPVKALLRRYDFMNGAIKMLTSSRVVYV